MSEAEELAAAQVLLRTGRLEEAAEAFAALVERLPQRADLWHLRAIVAHQLGRVPQAREFAARAIALDGAVPGFHLLAGHVAVDADDLAAAAGHFEAAVARKPDWVAAWIALGNARLDASEFAAARDALERAVALDPRAARAWNALGLAELELAHPEEATRAFRQAIAADPRHAGAHLNLARLANREGRFDDALASLESAIAADPRQAEALLLRMQILRRRRDPRAGPAHEEAVGRLPEDARVRVAWAEYLWELGRADDARAEFERAQALDPRNLRAALGARLVLPAIYRDPADLETNRGRYARGLEELHAQASRFAGASPGTALAGATWTNFYLAYQGRNDRELQSRYGDFLAKVLRPSLPEYFADRARPRRGGRLRVGFYSYFFFNCTAGRYFASWIHDLDPARFEKVVFYTNPWVADDTRAIAASVERFHHVAGYPLQAIARAVAAEELDVLVFPELGMHPDTFALAALRLAPVQVAGWGHPTTTGLASIDAFLSCAEMEPPGAQEAYRERLVGLPGIGTRYQRPRTGATKTREELGLPADATLYLCPQSLFKIHPDNDELFARVLAGDPRGRLVFFGYREGAVTRQYRQRLLAALARAGVDGESRALFLGFLPHGDYLRVNQLCDAMLDTLHWSGGNTSLDAIAAGLPMVTLPGELMRGRQSAAMLRRLGLDELVARDVEDYVGLALRLGTDPAWRGDIRRALEERAGSLFDDAAPVAALADALEELARRPV
jgi:CRISPR-associated protein Csy1